jgi:CubicO group peptidase (beta-lactamase class C family)
MNRESKFAGRGRNGGRLTRRQVMKRSLAGLAGAAAMTIPPLTRISAQTSATSFDIGQRAAAEGIVQREVDSGNVPGIGWSIGNAKETLAEGAVGFRVVSPATPMDAATRCALASVSKQFTATCVYMLRDEGKLSLDAPLADYLPDYRYASKMTLRQVLTMSSGISSDTEACEAPLGGRLDNTALIENLNRLELQFPPGCAPPPPPFPPCRGAHFAYSNCAYDVAGAVVAKLSGMAFGRFVEKRIFKPLGMNSSYQLGTRTDPDFAQGYAPDGKGWKPAPFSDADKTFASGNLASNRSDMQRWDRALLNATLLPKTSMEEMFTIATLSSGAKTIYASGWFIEPSGLIWHIGALGGYGTVNALVPSTGHAIVLLGNTTPGERWKPWEVAREIYNTTKLGPTLPDFLPLALTTVPQ